MNVDDDIHHFKLARVSNQQIENSGLPGQQIE
jgi:hypothetical protein